MTTSETDAAATVMGQRVARAATAEAELVGVTAERDALREQNEQLLREAEHLTSNLYEFEGWAADPEQDGARWFTAVDAEPEDAFEHGMVLCNPGDGSLFDRPKGAHGHWRALHLSHTYFEWADMVGEYGPLMMVRDESAARRAIDEMTRRRNDENTVRSAVWNAERTIADPLRSYQLAETSAPTWVVELRDRLQGLAKVPTFGQGPANWSTNAAAALTDLSAVVSRLASQQRHAARAATDHTDLVQLVDWMAARGDSTSELAEAVRKPWKYSEEIALVRSIRDHEATNTGHTCRPDAHADGREPWYCDAGADDCDWHSSIPV